MQNLKNFSPQDLHWMQHAITLAQRAETENEVPIGALVVLENQIIGEGWNQSITLGDPTAHAEVIALRNAAQKIGNYRLLNTTLYVTLEPCVMCAGAIMHARIQRLVFGATDPKAGAIKSIFNILEEKQLNHHVLWEEGICAEQCGALLKNFFKIRRVI